MAAVIDRQQVAACSTGAALGADIEGIADHALHGLSSLESPVALNGACVHLLWCTPQLAK